MQEDPIIMFCSVDQRRGAFQNEFVVAHCVVFTRPPYKVFFLLNAIDYSDEENIQIDR